MSPPLTNAQRRKNRRDSRGDLEIRRDHDRRSEMRRSQIQAGTSSSSSAAIGSSSSSSTAIQNVNNLLNDEDEGNSFSEDSLERSFTRSPVKKRPLVTKKQPP
jgi:hypothetical protein